MSVNISEIKNFCHNKNVIIVGNSSSQISDYSDFDVVVKINTGLNEGPCDIWVDNLNYEGGVIINDRSLQFNGQYEGNILIKKNKGFFLHDHTYRLRLCANQRGYFLKHKDIPKIFDNNTYYWNIKDFDIMINETYNRPSTGLMSVYWFYKFIPYSSLNITGFDFFKTVNRYEQKDFKIHENFPGLSTLNHNPIIEEKIINHLINLNLIKKI